MNGRADYRPADHVRNMGHPRRQASSAHLWNLHRCSLLLPLLTLFLALASAEGLLQRFEGLDVAPFGHSDLLQVCLTNHAMDQTLCPHVSDVVTTQVILFQFCVVLEEKSSPSITSD